MADPDINDMFEHIRKAMESVHEQQRPESFRMHPETWEQVLRLHPVMVIEGIHYLMAIPVELDERIPIAMILPWPQDPSW